MDRTPPRKVEAEQALLGSLIADQDMYKRVAGIVTPESFYVTKHQHIFKAIENLAKDKKPVDAISISEELTRLKINMNKSDIVMIVNAMPTGARAEYYAGIVAEYYARRQAIINAQNQIEAAYDTSQDIAETIATAKKNMITNIPGRKIESAIYPEILNVQERVIDATGKKIQNFIPTGLTKIDRRMNMRSGRLTVIASDPGVGKTSLMLCIMRNMVKNNMRPVMFSLEMTREEIIENIIAQEARVCHRDMVSGDLTDLDIKKMSKKASEFKNLNLGVLDNEFIEWTVSAMRNQLIDEMEQGLDAVFIDSLGLIRPPKDAPRNEGRSVIYNTICEDLVRMGTELKIPVILAHHLNKDSSKRSKDWRPTLQSLDFAGERYAHNVGFIYRECMVHATDDNTDKAEFIIAKARDGIPGTIDLQFDGPTKTFRNVEQYRTPPAVMAGGKQWGN